VSSLLPVSGDHEGILALLREWDAANDPPPLIIETSGSTGQPKRVMLSRDAMRASALATQERLGGPGQWVLNLPPTYVAGVQVLYRSVVAGTEPLLHSGSFARDRDGAGGRLYVSLVATQLRRLVEQPSELDALALFDAVLLGGGPVQEWVRQRAEANGVPVVATYGMSETCGGCVYDGVALAGAEFRIDDDGQILLRGPMLFDGYEGEPERTAAAFRDGWLITNDLGHLAWDGSLRVDARSDDVIISGGVKVPPQAVERMIGDHFALDLAVVGVPDDEWGERVAVVVGVEGDHDGWLTLDRVRECVEPRSWAPRQLVVVPGGLPELANGKPDRVALKKLAADV
jgi:O-succinylbenzoic acid--CoA ligase